MNRRGFLASAGVALSLGVVGWRRARPSDPLVVRVWFSDAAAEYDGLGARVEGYLGRALTDVFDSVEVDLAPSPLSLATENGRDLLAVRWPAMVVEGAVGMGDVDPVDGVNLLVTDGDPRRQPAGYGRRRVAAATGAKFIARMAPAEETPWVVPYTLRAAATQVLLHEVGHALGIGHEHGRARRAGDALVASPMVGSYLWARRSVRKRHLPEKNACGGVVPSADAAPKRRLRLRYADCAVQALR